MTVAPPSSQSGALYENGDRAHPEIPSIGFRTLIAKSSDPETLGRPPQHHL
jgi:hypothetical protein